MATYRAIVHTGPDKPLSLETFPKPTAQAGEVIVRVLSTCILPYMQAVLTGTGPYPLALPLTPGQSAIGRVEQLGPDAVRLTQGQLVLCDNTIRARDDPDVTILMGLFARTTPEARKVMYDPWRNGTFAEYVKAPLENVFALDEAVLLHQMHYSVHDLGLILPCLVPFGGLADVSAKAGDVVIVAPATGFFGGAALVVALAMGARVIAAGRNSAALASLTSTFGGATGRFTTVMLNGDAAVDTAALRTATPHGVGADAYIDFSPPAAADSTHVKAALCALRPRGRAVFMGGIAGDVKVPYGVVMHGNLQIRGRYMYGREDVLQMIKMVEAGNLRLRGDAGVGVVGPFTLERVRRR